MSTAENEGGGGGGGGRDPCFYSVNVSLSKPFYGPGDTVLGTVTCTRIGLSASSSSSSPSSSSFPSTNSAHAGGAAPSPRSNYSHCNSITDYFSSLSLQVHGHVFAPPRLLKELFEAPLSTVEQEMKARQTPKSNNDLCAVPDMTFFSAPRSGVCVLRSKICRLPLSQKRSSDREAVAEGQQQQQQQGEPRDAQSRTRTDPPEQQGQTVAVFHFSAKLPRNQILLPSYSHYSDSPSGVNVWYCVSLCAQYNDPNRLEHCLHIPFRVQPSRTHSMHRHHTGALAAAPVPHRQQQHEEAARCLAVPASIVEIGAVQLLRSEDQHARSGKATRAEAAGFDGGSHGPSTATAAAAAAATKAATWQTHWMDGASRVAFEALRWNTVSMRDFTRQTTAASSSSFDLFWWQESEDSTAPPRDDEETGDDAQAEPPTGNTYQIRSSSTGPVALLTILCDRVVPGSDVEVAIDCDAGSLSDRGDEESWNWVNCDQVQVRLVCTHRFPTSPERQQPTGEPPVVVATMASKQPSREVTEERTVDAVSVDFTAGVLRTSVCMTVPAGAFHSFRTPLVCVEWWLKFEFTCPVRPQEQLASPSGNHNHNNNDNDKSSNHQSSNNNNGEAASARSKVLRWNLPVFVHPAVRGGMSATMSLGAEEFGRESVFPEASPVDAVAPAGSNPGQNPTPPTTRRSLTACEASTGNRVVALHALDAPLSEHVFVQTTSKTILL